MSPNSGTWVDPIAAQQNGAEARRVVHPVNSEGYWSQRFGENWEALNGPAHSRFFCHLAIQNLPGWLTSLIRTKRASICDWGCATGDGTDVVSRAFGTPVLGVDFSEVAIGIARARHKKPEFLVADFLKNSDRKLPRYDVLFTSNTLQHFVQPWNVLEKLSEIATRVLVILVPFREYERDQEHESTFDESNIPLKIADDFHLVHAHVMDTRDATPCYWDGEQILLVYAKPLVMHEAGLRLSDIKITGAKDQKILDAQLDRERRFAGLREELKRMAARVLDREGRISALEADIEAIHHSRSWRVTSPIRTLSQLTRKCVNSGLARSGSLPAWKHRLRSVISGRPRLPEASTGLIDGQAQLLHGPGIDVSHQAELVPPGPAQEELTDVFVWGIIDWHFRVQRPQHIARSLARRGHRTYYLSSKFIDSPEPGYHIEELAADGLLNLVYLHVAGAPSIYAAAPSEVIRKAVLKSLSLLLVEVAPASVLSIVQHPFWTSFADAVPNRRLVYDMMDHHEGFGDGASDILALEERILTQADQVVVTSAFLEKIARSKNRAVTVIRNACEYEHFVETPDLVFKDAMGRRVIGYYGAIAHWFDADMIEQVVKRFPDDLILLVGADTIGLQKRLKGYSNVRFTGEVPYKQLPYFLHGFDVCILPFKVIPLTLATNPVKIYEYLSAGKPVVSVELPEITQFGGLVSVAGNPEAFLDQIGGVLTHPPTAEEAEKRRQFASRQTWDHRAAALVDAIGAFKPPRATIVIVTYNNLDLTHACLTSLELNTRYCNFEIIVVDNSSQDGTQDYLRRWANKSANRSIILNDQNRGFAAANNQGLAQATGDYFVLLNNDTYLTPGWLGTLISHLKREPELGLVGPVTNSIGNEAKIEIFYSNVHEMQRAARAYTASRLGQLHPLRTAAFFCVAFSRAHFGLVGPLDEDFGIGMFEDDDYSRRIERVGLRSACAEDVFVHHQHSASFNQISIEERAALFEANKEIYERKWGRWIPHIYRSG